jgi:hypothetical protein
VLCVTAKREFHGSSFGRIVIDHGITVSAYVVNRPRLDTGVANRHNHGARPGCAAFVNTA